MNSVREIAAMFCGAAVLSAAVLVLAPSSLNSSSKYITALIMLCVLVSGIARGNFSFDFSNFNNNAQTAASTEAKLSQYQAEYLVGELLSGKGVEYRNISAKATKSEDGSIIISEIKIEGANDKGGVDEVLSSAGIDCRVVFE